MAAPDTTAFLESGQTLKRPLIHPASGQIFLPAGSVLTDHLVNRLKRLGLEREVLLCLQEGPTQASTIPSNSSPTLKEHVPVSRPDRVSPPEVKPPDSSPEDPFDKGLRSILSHAGSKEPSLVPVMGLIKTMIQRLRTLELGTFPAIRIFGGGDTAHPINVTMLSLLIGIAMNRSEAQLFRLGQAALLHDIGKYGLDPRLVSKTEPLTSAERRVLERHVEFGLDALMGHRAKALGLSPEVLAAIHGHHERWDGSGYPRGLKRHRIPLDARILAVADVYETMTTDRPYRPRRLAGDAYREILRLSGEAFDPQVVEAFQRALVPYPNQTLLELSSGQVGHVIRQGSTPELPLVHLGRGAGVLDLALPGSPRIVKQHLPRRHPRLAIERPIRLALVGQDGAQPGQIHDLSLGGAKVASARALAVGTQVLLALETSRDGDVWIPGVVASCATLAKAPAHLGIRFLPLSAAAKQALEGILSQASRG